MKLRTAFAPIILFGALFSNGHEPPPLPERPTGEEKPWKIARIMSPADAIALAYRDSLSLNPGDALLTRYIWLGSTGSNLDAKSATIILNIISRSSIIARADFINNNLMRVYLPDYAPKADDLKEWLKFWEDLQFDPSFNLLLTKGTIRSAKKTLLVDVKLPGKHEKFDVIRVNGPHIDNQTFVNLQLRLQSQAPVVSLWYFAQRVLETIKDDNNKKDLLYATIYGGRYYEFAGIKKAKDKFDDADNATDLDVFLDRHKIGSVVGQVKAAKFFDDLRSDQRAALFSSGVTKKPRRVDWFHSADNRDGMGFISVTRDLRRRDIDIDVHPLMNLVDFKSEAAEAIAEKGNGFHEYGIFGANEELLDETTNDVVIDDTYTWSGYSSLQPAISCIACHEAKGHNGWIPVKNDIRDLVNDKKNLDILTDLNDLRKPLHDVINRLRSWYAGDFDESAWFPRMTYARSVLRAGGPWPDADQSGQTEVVKVAMSYLVDKTRHRQHALVTPQTALTELGYQAPGHEEQALARLLAPDPAARINEFAIEDIRIGALARGTPIQRTDWDLVFPFAAIRAAKNFKGLEKKDE